MKRLGGTDALFLSMETPDWHQHVSGLTVLDPEGRDICFDDVAKRIEERLAYAPKFRWRVQEVPFGLDRPGWVDDTDFDVLRHVRRIAVPSPGGARQLGELVGTIASMKLDRRRPLWELWYIEGLVGGKLALMLKYHHCLLDGMAGASLATALLDLEPDATEPLVPPPAPEDLVAGPEETNLQLLADLFRLDIRRPVDLVRYFTGFTQKAASAVESMRTDEGARAGLRPPRTLINGNVGPRRELVFASIPFADVVALKKMHGVKVNDVIIAVSAGALRRYLEQVDALPDTPLVTAVGVSTRSEGDETQNNQVSNMFASMATDIDDPLERLAAIARSTSSAKAMNRAMSAHQIQSLGDIAAPMIVSAATKAVYRTHLIPRVPIGANTLVSNVPGPPVPLYMCGARVTAIYPGSILLDSMGVNITVMSYENRFDFGLQVDPDMVPQPWTLPDCFQESMEELLEASGLTPTTITDPFSEVTSGS